MQKLSEQEFHKMISLLYRYTSYEMDQFENWSMDTDNGKVFIEISRKPSGEISAYDNLDKFVMEGQ